MKTLILDTSQERGIVAFAQGGEIVLSYELPFGLHNSQKALLLIQEGIQLLGGTLDAVICGHGPGSYTGMRVGASIARALCYARKIPLIGVSALQALDPHTVALLDAKTGGVYGSFYGKEPGLFSLEELKSSLEGVTYLVSSAKEPLSSRLQLMIPIEEKAPDPLLMLRNAKGKTGFSLNYLQEWKGAYRPPEVPSRAP